MKVKITDTLTDYLERVKFFQGHELGEKLKLDFIEFNDENVPRESGSLSKSPTKYSTITDTGSSININVEYSGDAPYSYRKDRPWKDFLPDQDYALFQHTETQNYGYVSEGLKDWESTYFIDLVSEYYMKFLE